MRLFDNLAMASTDGGMPSQSNIAAAAEGALSHCERRRRLQDWRHWRCWSLGSRLMTVPDLTVGVDIQLNNRPLLRANACALSCPAVARGRWPLHPRSGRRARAIRAVARAAVRPRGQQLDRELTDMLENPKFNFVCTECGSMSIAAPRIPLAQAPETTVIPCGGCGASRGTLATLRELARSGSPQQDDTTAQKAPWCARGSWQRCWPPVFGQFCSSWFCIPLQVRV